MKIGIMTFHWATNYGAVLQAYALQRFLTFQGHQADVINYVPLSHSIKINKCINIYSAKDTVFKLIKVLKERKIDKFRTKNLQMSVRKYNAYEELLSSPPEYDAYVTGSDQVWNPSFTSKGEGKLTLSYFLEFGSPEVHRIAYAVSFGCSDYPDYLNCKIKPILEKYTAISVRENSGNVILQRMGILNSQVLPDPTLLLPASEFDLLIDTNRSRSVTNSIVVYLVNTALDRSLKKSISQVASKMKCKVKYICGYRGARYGIEDWISTIKTSRYMITDSYHGIIFSILYKINFTAILLQGKGAKMNDRIFTLLEKLEIQRSVIKSKHVTSCALLDSMHAKVDWNAVHSKIEEMKIVAKEYFHAIDN